MRGSSKAWLIAATAGVISIGSQVAPAAIMYWDASNASGLTAGSGHWRTSGGGPNGQKWATSISPGTTAPVTWTNGNDAVFQVSGTNNISVEADVSVNSITVNGTGYTVTGNAGNTLSLVGSGTITTNQALTLSAEIGGSVGFTKDGASTLTFGSGTANTYTGTAQINNGTLILNKTSGVAAITGALTIGTTGGSSVLSSVQLDASNQIDDNSVVTVKGTSGAYMGTLNLNNNSDTIGTLAIQGGSVTTGTGALTVSTDYTNTNFGSGNTFNAKGAGTGAVNTGLINAAGNRDQTITGTGVSGGATNNVTFNLGSFREGNINASSDITINWGGDAVGPTLRGAVKTDTLNGANGFSATASDFTLVSNNSSTNKTVNFVLNGATAGVKSGGTMSVLNNFDDVRDQTVTVSATVYREATASVTNTVNFGIVHVGDIDPSQAITISNTASNDGFSDDLEGTLTNLGPGLYGGGTVLVAGGGSNNTLALNMDTAFAGVVNTTAEVALTSKGQAGTGLADVDLTDATINVTGTVNQYAAVDLNLVSGDGSLSGVGSEANPYVLDFGTLNQNDSGGEVEAFLALVNDVIGQADYLKGSFAGASGGFDLTGFVAFDSIAAGNNHAMSVALDTTNLGSFSTTITLSPRSTNGTNGTFDNNYDQPLASGDVAIVLQGTIVPEPTSAGLVVLAGSLMAVRRRRR